MGVKQVIIVRKDLNMRKGKMIAQGAHASVSIVMDLMDLKCLAGSFATNEALDYFDKWREAGQKKITLGVNSEAELGAIYQKAVDAGITAVIITDAGHTEFKGVSTKTSVAIGPWNEEDVDEITGELGLL